MLITLSIAEGWKPLPGLPDGPAMHSQTAAGSRAWVSSLPSHSCRSSACVAHDSFALGWVGCTGAPTQCQGSNARLRTLHQEGLGSFPMDAEVHPTAPTLTGLQMRTEP